MSKIRLGIIGFAHMHIGQMVTSFQAMPEEFEWVGCADVPPAVDPLSNASGTRRQVMESVVKKCGIPKVFDDYRDLFAEDPDWIFVTAENVRHPALVQEVLSHGIHVILEKPMALDLAGAVGMAKMAKEKGAKLVVNWPTVWDPAFRTACRLCRDGAVGTPFKFHYRNKESLGPFSYGQSLTDEEKAAEWWYQADMGGGAMADYIGYGCNLSRWFFGERAQSAFAIRSNFSSGFADVDDFSAATLQFSSSVALLEGSWATFASGAVPCGPIVFGDAGTLVTDRLSPEVRLYLERHKLEATKTYAADPLPEGRANLAQEILHHLRSGEPLFETLDLPVNLDAAAAIDACFRSVKSGKLETVLAPDLD